MNQEAFWERQYEQNIDRMVGVCYRYVANLPLAEDLAHSAFLKAIEKSDTYHATGKFGNWLMKNSPVVSLPIKESESTETEKIVVTKVVPVRETTIIRDTITRRDTVWVP